MKMTDRRRIILAAIIWVAEAAAFPLVVFAYTAWTLAGRILKLVDRLTWRVLPWA